MTMRRILAALTAVALAACGGMPTRARRSPHPLPDDIQKLAIRNIVNKTQQFGLEDALSLALRDEFLRDARYPIAPEPEADAVVAITLTRYLLTPIQYDVNLNPTTYKLRVLADVSLIDRRTNKPLWARKDVEETLSYPNVNLLGGLSETAARAELWTIMAPDIVTQLIDGYSSGAAEAAKAAAVSTSTAAAPPQAPPASR
jgi:hypothetical protein